MTIQAPYKTGFEKWQDGIKKAVGNAKWYEVTVKAGDSLDKIAKNNCSTIEVLKNLNPTANILRPGQTLKYQKASVQRVVTGWRSLTTTSIALRYNSMQRYPNYAKKLDFALDLIRKGNVVLCAH